MRFIALRDGKVKSIIGKLIQDSSAFLVRRAFGLALHGVRHSKTPGIFGLWIEVALQLQECRVEAKVECNMALQGRTLRALEFLSGVRKFHSALRKLFVA